MCGRKALSKIDDDDVAEIAAGEQTDDADERESLALLEGRLGHGNSWSMIAKAGPRALREARGEAGMASVRGAGGEEHVL